jgi:precorrin-6B methylase 2
MNRLLLALAPLLLAFVSFDSRSPAGRLLAQDKPFGSPVGRLAQDKPFDSPVGRLAQDKQEEKLPPPPDPLYETREKHDPNGIGKFYLGREIAHVMGAAGIPWLERPQREDEERPTKLIEALDLKGDEVVCDLGAGSGYYTFRLAPKLEKGKVIAVEIQDDMIKELKKNIEAKKATNVEIVKGTEKDPKLAEKSVDIILMVDVYHELEFPYETMLAIRKALKPGARVVFVEFRKEDPKVPIKEVHKMSEEQVKKEMAVVGLTHVKTVGTLPWQHILIFKK